MVRDHLLEAAERVLREKGYGSLSTREVAAAAKMTLSQIHYYFGSKQAMILAVFEHKNAQLLTRQEELFTDDTLAISEQWERACDYLDEDLDSGYVRILMELLSAGWSNPEIADVVREALSGWTEVLMRLSRASEARFGKLEPFSLKDIAALIACAFIGAEAHILLGNESAKVPVRRALRKVATLLRTIESEA